MERADSRVRFPLGKDFAEGMTGKNAFERKALRDGFYRAYGKFFDISNINPQYYKETFIKICRLINGTKINAIDRHFVISGLVLDEGYYKQVLDEVIDDLAEKGYLIKQKRKGRQYLAIGEKGYAKLNLLGVKLKGRN
jgi:hypothetical protein